MDISTMLLGMALGGAWMVSRIGRMAGRGPYWMYKWFHPRSPYGDNRSLMRLKKALHPSKDHRWSIFNPLPVTLFASFFIIVNTYEDTVAGIGLGLSLGFVGTGVVSMLTGTLKKYNLDVLSYAAMEVARRLDPSLGNQYLVPLAQHPSRQVREAILPALRALGTPEAVDALDYIRHQASEPNLIQEARSAGDQLLALSAGVFPPAPVANMQGMAAKHKLLFPTMSKGKKTREHERDRAHLQDLELAMDEVVFSQLNLRRSFPHVFCKACYTRSEMLAYESWSWVRCRRCHEATHLVPHARQAIGVIGASEPWHLEDGQLRIALWDEEKRHALAAEVEILEIVAGHAIHYDWAVSAVLSKLESQGYTEAARKSNRGRIEVRLIGLPPLEANSLHLLRMVDPFVQENDAGDAWSHENVLAAMAAPALNEEATVGEESL